MRYKTKTELYNESESIDGLSGVYFLWLNDEMVYIGQSQNGTSRILEHKKDKSYNYYTWMPVSVYYLTAVEGMYINKYKPLYNKVIPKFNMRSVAKFFCVGIDEMKRIAKPTPIKRRFTESIHKPSNDNTEQKRVVIKLTDDEILQKRINDKVDRIADIAIKRARSSKRVNVRGTKKIGRKYKHIKSGAYN